MSGRRDGYEDDTDEHEAGRDVNECDVNKHESRRDVNEDLDEDDTGCDVDKLDSGQRDVDNEFRYLHYCYIFSLRPRRLTEVVVSPICPPEVEMITKFLRVFEGCDFCTYVCAHDHLLIKQLYLVKWALFPYSRTSLVSVMEH